MQNEKKIALVTGGSRGLGKSMALKLAEKGNDVIITYRSEKAKADEVVIYASMKGAIEVFTRYLAKELGSRGITANVVAPGPVETDFNNGAIRNAPPERRNGIMANTALGRLAHADDISGVIAFLCSEDAGWISGQRIEASGGINL
jgi:NAD(P)-dependent dehydrogenase (short-subunit alcohol dehydrogenase family)